MSEAIVEATNNAVNHSQYLTFELDKEEYAIGILRVKEIIQYDTLTRVPAVPSFIRGVINLRGNVVAVIDLGTKFGLPDTAITKRTCIVIVEVDQDGEATEVGVMADAVSQVVELPPEAIQPPPKFGSRVNVDFLEALAQLDSKFALILDIDRVLSSEELQVVASIDEVLEAENETSEEANDSGSNGE